MPLKEFECESCHHRFEVIVWLKEPDPAVCEKCGKAPLKQILGTFRITGVSSKSKTEDEGAGDLDAGLDDAGGDFGGGGDEGDWGGGGDEDPGSAPDSDGGDAGGLEEPAGGED